MFSEALTFAEVLRRQRQARGLTQEDLPERATLSARTISDLERGLKESPHSTTIHLLVRALALGARPGQARRAFARSVGGSCIRAGSGVAAHLSHPWPL
jgi:transcriptional regulator with XRE-family HTH domain